MQALLLVAYLNHGAVLVVPDQLSLQITVGSANIRSYYVNM